MISVQTAANRILASLPQEERGLILSSCDEVGLRLGDASLLRTKEFVLKQKYIRIVVQRAARVAGYGQKSLVEQR